MTRTVFVLSPEDSIQHAARLLRDRRFGALPVLDGRSLVGIVSVVDVLGAIA
jgi:acetoin utilization protein AcuB